MSDHKEKIIDVSLRLFAQKGYSATGVREIVREANVSLSSVNYHFGNKEGVLRAILDRFFESYKLAIIDGLDGNLSLEENIREFFKRIVRFFRNNISLVRIAILEFPIDHPDTIDYRARKIQELRDGIVGKLFKNKVPGKDLTKVYILAPTMVGSVAFHFLLRPLIETVLEKNFDDSFYEEYTEELSELFLNGINGLIKKGTI